MDTFFCPIGVWIRGVPLYNAQDTSLIWTLSSVPLVSGLATVYYPRKCANSLTRITVCHAWSKLWLSAIGRQSSMLYTIDRNTGHLQVHALHSGATYVVVDWPADMHYT